MQRVREKVGNFAQISECRPFLVKLGSSVEFLFNLSQTLNNLWLQLLGVGCRLWIGKSLKIALVSLFVVLHVLMLNCKVVACDAQSLSKRSLVCLGDIKVQMLKVVELQLPVPLLIILYVLNSHKFQSYEKIWNRWVSKYDSLLMSFQLAENRTNVKFGWSDITYWLHRLYFILKCHLQVSQRNIRLEYSKPQVKKMKTYFL